MATGLRAVTERMGEGAGRPIFDAVNGEELIHKQPGVAVALGGRQPELGGTLYISTKKFVWLSDTDRTKGYAVDFLSVSLHAVSTDPDSYPLPCIYTQIENGADDHGMEDSDADVDDELDFLSTVTEMRIIPSDPSQLDTLFSVFCDCAELNPDPTEEEGDEHDWVFSADQLEDDTADSSEWTTTENAAHPIGANGVHDLPHSLVQLRVDDQRFEDAEELEQDVKNGHH